MKTNYAFLYDLKNLMRGRGITSISGYADGQIEIRNEDNDYILCNLGTVEEIEEEINEYLKKVLTRAQTGVE